MKSRFFTLQFLIILLFITGCASSYKPINPQILNYTAHDVGDGIGLSYKYEVLRERGNRKYAKKEDRKGLKIVAIKLTNNTDEIINIGRDVAFFSGDTQVLPVEPNVAKSLLKQSVASYLLYLVLTPLKLYVIKGNSYDTYSIGYVFGPGLTLINTATAGSANKRFLLDMIQYNILGKDIQPGETVYGIIGIRGLGYNPLSVRYIN